MKLSKRTETLQVSPTRKFTQLASQMEKKGKKILRLSVGQPDIEAPSLFFQAMASYPKRTLPYPPSQGLEGLRQAQSDYYKQYGIDYTKEEIFITSGATEAIIFSILSLCDPKDSVLVIEPFYANYKLIANILGNPVYAIPTSIKNNYEIPSLEEMEKALKPDTKVLLFSNPSNPTGRIYSKEELDRLAAFALKHDLFIISDEVYRELNLSGHPFHSMAAYEELKDQLILLDSASKKYAVCGARIGSIASKNKELTKNLMKLCQMRIATATIEQYAVSKCMEELKEDYFQKVVQIYKKRKDLLNKRLKELHLAHSEPEGAFYTLVQLPVEDAEDFQTWLLEEFEDQNETILMAPALGFYLTENLGRDEVRISYCVEEKILERTMDILKIALEAYKNK